MPKLPSLKRSNPIGVSSLSQARTGNTTSLNPNNLAQFGGVLAKIGESVLNFKGKQIAQENEIFGATQETELRSQLNKAFVAAPDESLGASPSGSDTIERYVEEFSRLNKQINTISDAGIKQQLLNKANVLASGHIASLNAVSINKRNTFNANQHEIDLNKKIETILINPDINTLTSELNSISSDVNKFFGFNSNKDIEKITRSDKAKVFEAFLDGVLIQAIDNTLSNRELVISKARELVMSKEFTDQFGSNFDRFKYLKKIETFEIGQLTKQFKRISIPNSIYKKNNKIKFERIQESFLKKIVGTNGDGTKLDKIEIEIDSLNISEKEKESLRATLRSKENFFSKESESKILNMMSSKDADLGLINKVILDDNSLSLTAKLRLLDKAKTLRKISIKTNTKYKQSLKRIDDFFLKDDRKSARGRGLSRLARSLFMDLVTDPSFKGVSHRDLEDIAQVNAQGNPSNFKIPGVGADTVQELLSEKKRIIENFKKLSAGSGIGRTTKNRVLNTLRQINIKIKLIKSKESFDKMFKNLPDNAKRSINSIGGN